MLLLGCQNHVATTVRKDELFASCVEASNFKLLRRVACQVLPLTRLGEGAQALDALVDKFQDWQEITNSIFC